MTEKERQDWERAHKAAMDMLAEREEKEREAEIKRSKEEAWNKPRPEDYTDPLDFER